MGRELVSEINSVPLSYRCYHRNCTSKVAWVANCWTFMWSQCNNHYSSVSISLEHPVPSHSPPGLTASQPPHILSHRSSSRSLGMWTALEPEQWWIPCTACSPGCVHVEKWISMMQGSGQELLFHTTCSQLDFNSVLPSSFVTLPTIQHHNTTTVCQPYSAHAPAKHQINCRPVSIVI